MFSLGPFRVLDRSCLFQSFCWFLGGTGGVFCSFFSSGFRLRGYHMQSSRLQRYHAFPC